MDEELLKEWGFTFDTQAVRGAWKRFWNSSAISVRLDQGSKVFVGWYGIPGRWSHHLQVHYFPRNEAAEGVWYLMSAAQHLDDHNELEVPESGMFSLQVQPRRGFSGLHDWLRRRG